MVQIYQNPQATTAANIANQHNPDFAAFNAVMGNFHNAPITEALAQTEIDNDYADKVGGLKRAQLQRKWAKGDQDLQYLRGLREEIARRGGDVSKINSINDALITLPKYNDIQNLGAYVQPDTLPQQGMLSGRQIGTKSLKGLAQIAQNGSNFVPNMSSTQQDIVNALTGINDSDLIKQINAENQRYRDTPSADRTKLDALMEQYNAIQKDKMYKSKKPNVQQTMSTPKTWWQKNIYDSDKVSYPFLRGLIKGDQDQEMYNRILMAKPWANVAFNQDNMFDSTSKSEQLQKQQQFITAIEKDLQEKRLYELDKSAIQRLLAQIPEFRYNPETQIVIQDGAGRIGLYNVIDSSIDMLM